MCYVLYTPYACCEAIHSSEVILCEDEFHTLMDLDFEEPVQEKCPRCLEKEKEKKEQKRLKREWWEEAQKEAAEAFEKSV